MTPAEQYACGVAVLERGRAAMLAREESAAEDIEHSAASLMEAMTTFAAAYIERTRSSERERDAYVDAVAAINDLAATLGIDARYEVPAPQIPTEGAAGALHRATARGTSAVVFELASIVAGRAAREM